MANSNSWLENTKCQDIPPVVALIMFQFHRIQVLKIEIFRANVLHKRFLLYIYFAFNNHRITEF